MKKIFPAFACLALSILVQALDNPGFISIDCGASTGYLDDTLKIEYTTDEGYIDSGVNMPVLPKYFNRFNVRLNQLLTVRAFPTGMRNCYTVWPKQGKNNRYLIRATFAYGNYDDKSQFPSFALYIDVNLWGNINPSGYTYDEIVYTPTRDYIHICLVNLDSGTPFISALELRLLDNSTYAVPSGALRKYWCYNIGSDQLYLRYPQDYYDRIWEGKAYDIFTTITNTANVDVLNRNNDAYKVPVEVLMTAQRSDNFSFGMELFWSSSSTYGWWVYLHFAEFEILKPGQLRQLNVTANENIIIDLITPEYLKPVTVSTLPFSGDKVNFSIMPSSKSNVASFINAIEIFQSLDLPNSPTDLNNAKAMFDIKKTYGVVKDFWQGDPCVPKEFAWSGLTCSNDKFPRIVSLNLSSSGLVGSIANSFSNLSALTSLDLSSNQLTGQIPEYFAHMANLKIINLSNNKLTGVIPPALQQRVDDKTLTLSVNENALSPSSPKPTKKSIVVPVAAAVGSVVGVALILCFIFILRRNKNKGYKATEKANQSTMVADQFNAGSNKVASWSESGERDGFKGEVQPKIVAKNRPFNSQEVFSITKGLSTVIGEGGFGKVYHGTLSDGKQVAIKVLSQSSKQGYKEFQAEAQLLMVVHHKNLVSLVGYCEEFDTMALLYEYMPNGDLRKSLADRVSILSWSRRLQIAVDAAQGLDYLHNGCTPPIIHRDLKTPNILLDEKMQAKIADFGLSRVFATDSTGNQISSTRPAGTPGYLDPVFNTSGNLNTKSDVYSFGIILFELITGQAAIIRNDFQTSTHIVKWVTSLVDGGDIQRIVDSRIQGQFNTGSAWKAIEIAMQCVQMRPIHRPDMNRVLSDLVECLSMETGTGPRRNNQGEEGISLASTTSFDMKSLELDMGHMAPRAR